MAARRIAMVMAEHGLNLRLGPDRDCPRVGVLPAGTQVTALVVPPALRRSGWTAVSAGDVAGWVMTEHLAFGG